MVTNCKNCGAPLKSGKCEYCSTEHQRGEIGTPIYSATNRMHIATLLTPNEARKIIGLEEK